MGLGGRLPYNGGIDHAQGEIKERLRRHEGQPRSFLAIQAVLDAQALNHRPRAILGHRSPREIFTAGRPCAHTFTRPKRKEAYNWIRAKTLELTAAKCYDPNMAWRVAIETWMLDNRFITVSKNGYVLPILFAIRSYHPLAPTINAGDDGKNRLARSYGAVRV
jgi:hypothetical protein